MSPGYLPWAFAKVLMEINMLVVLGSNDAPGTQNPSSGQNLSDRVYNPAIVALAFLEIVPALSQAMDLCPTESHPYLLHQHPQVLACDTLHSYFQNLLIVPHLWYLRINHLGYPQRHNKPPQPASISLLGLPSLTRGDGGGRPSSVMSLGVASVGGHSHGHPASPIGVGSLWEDTDPRSPEPLVVIWGWLWLIWVVRWTT